MRRLPALMLALLPLGVLAQGTSPRTKPADYPVHGHAGGLNIGAEFLYRTVPAGADSIFVKDFLVVELALYGPDNTRVVISPGHFLLRINGSKRPVLPLSAEVVAYHQRWDSDWRGAAIETGDSRVVLDRPVPGPRFPDDPRHRLPRLPRMDTDSRDGAPRRARPEPVEVMKQAALPEEEQRLPVAGCLYFPYDKKTKSIKRLELIYQGPAGAVTLLLKSPPSGR